MSILVLAMIIAPTVALFGELGFARWRPRHRSGTAAALGAGLALAAAAATAVAVAANGPLSLGPTDAPWLVADGLTVVIALTVSAIGITVLTYARRSLDPGAEAVRVAAGGSAVLAATLTASAAGRLSVFVVGWVATTVALLVLLDRAGVAGRRAAARRAAASLGLGDLGLVIAAVLVAAVAGDPALDRLGEIVPTLAERSLAVGSLAVSALDVVAVLMVVAALARASQMPLPMWLPGTLAAPTPTSALLHAGVVNAGAILLLRSLDLVAAAPAAMWLLAIASLVTIAASLASLRARRDVKGALAVSTSAQMGFMLLAIAVGAPLAALTHLVGHALYKSARFLGAGDTIGAAVRRRSYAASVAGWPQGVRAASSVVIGLAAGGLAVLVFHGAEAWMVGGALAATAGTAGWAWLGRVPVSVGSLAGGLASIGALAVGYLAIASVIESAAAGAVPEVPVGGAAAPVALAVLVAIVVSLWVGGRHPTVAPRLAAVASSIGRLPAGSTTRSVPTGPLAAMRVELQRSTP